jgi:hypothetical protein
VRGTQSVPSCMHMQGKFIFETNCI